MLRHYLMEWILFFKNLRRKEIGTYWFFGLETCCLGIMLDAAVYGSAHIDPAEIFSAFD